MNEEILCKKCVAWVDCGEKDNKPYGFCLQEPLFTYTLRTICSEHIEGTPSTEKDFENFQNERRNGCRNL